MDTKKIKKLIGYSLSNEEIYNAFDGKIKILTYPELEKFNNIDELLEPYNKVIILYLTSANYGHWVTLFKINHNNIEFFDSYSMKPDEELKMIDKNVRIENNEVRPHLSYLLYNCNYNIHYNDVRLQKQKNDVNTCGRHCIVRLSCDKLFIDDYVKLIKSFKYDPDYIVTYLTESIK